MTPQKGVSHARPDNRSNRTVCDAVGNRVFDAQLCGVLRVVLNLARRAVFPRPDCDRVFRAAVPFTLLPAAWQRRVVEASGIARVSCLGTKTRGTCRLSCVECRSAGAGWGIRPGSILQANQELSATSGVGSMPAACPENRVSRRLPQGAAGETPMVTSTDRLVMPGREVTPEGKHNT